MEQLVREKTISLLESVVKEDKQLPKIGYRDVSTKGCGIVKQIELIFSDRLKICNRGGFIVAKIDGEKEYILNGFDLDEETNHKLKSLFKSVWDMTREKKKKKFIEEIFASIK